MAIFSAAGLSSAPVTNVVDEGPYRVRIDACEAILSAKKQTPGIKMELVILEGPIQNNGSNCVNRHIFSTLYIGTTEPGHSIGLQKLAKLCKAAEIEQTDDLDLADFIGKEVVAKIKHKMYDGEPQEEVSGFSKAI